MKFKFDKRTASRVLIALALGTAIILIMKTTTKNFDAQRETSGIGRSDIRIEDGKMTPEVLLAFGRLSDPQVSPDGTRLIYGVSYTSIEENRSCRNLFISDVNGEGKQQLTFSETSISNARWYGDGLLYLHGGQLWSAPLQEKDGVWKLGKAEKLSEIPAGISEFKLSPDERKILYVSTVKSAVDAPSDRYADLDKANAYTTDDLMYRHWDHTILEVAHSFVAAFDGKSLIVPETSTDILAGEKEIYELPTEPFNGIEQLDWHPDSRHLAYSCKKLAGKKYAFSTDTEIYIYDTETAATTQIVMKGGYDTNPIWSPDGKHLAWVSMPRDGYEADKQRLILSDVRLVPDAPSADIEVSNIRDYTADFRYNVAAPMWSADSKDIWFNALTEGIQAIYKAEIAQGTITRITGEDKWYDFGTPYYIEEGEGKLPVIYTTWCSMDFPTELVALHPGRIADKPDGLTPDGVYANTHIGPILRDGHSEPLMGTCDHDVVYRPVTRENEPILAQLKPHKTEARWIKTVDGQNMLTWVMYPQDFDASKTYPAIVICLGGPQGTLSQGWSYRWNYRLMSAQDYIVVMPNRRGTTAFGQEWTEQISGDYPGLNMLDYLTAARQIKKEPYVGKVAACGASYGGYSVYYLAGMHRNTFDCFIAHAGIFNEEHMYMTTEEMWFPNWDNGGLHECEFDPAFGTAEAMGAKGDGVTFGGIKQGGSPWSDLPKAKRHYALSPHKMVQNWDTPIMVIHGGSDFRVPVDEGMAAYNAAQMMGVPSRLLIFPDENHWILKPQNALFWHREYFSWLDQWCK